MEVRHLAVSFLILGDLIVNKKLKPGILLLLSLALLYFGGVSGGAFGAGLSVGGLVCFVAAIAGFIQKASKRNRHS